MLIGCAAQKQGLKPYHLPMLQEADLMFVQEDYHGAAAIYDRVLEVNPAHPESNLRAGICLLNMRNHRAEALKFLERAKEQQYPEAEYYIGLALHFHEQFDSAKSTMQSYLESGDKAIPEPEVRNSIAMVERAKEAYANQKNQRLINLGEEINSPFPDYVPLISADGTKLYFTSRRQGGVSNVLDPNGDFFEEIYQSQRTPSGWSEAVNIGSPVNTETHDATVALSPSGNKMLIYRTNKTLDGGDIYLTEMTENGWSEPEKLTERINSKHFEPSAAIAGDERTIFFASNRPGGYGGKDLYRVVELPDGTWSYPVNLGPKINSAGHEDGPFISVDGKTLYFSSTSHGSIGGYDIYKSNLDKESGEWSAPENLGHPINTVFDDIYLTLDASGKTGYYATNRKGGYGDHDIYRVEFGAENPMILVSGVIEDDKGQPVQAEITVDKTSGKAQMIYQSNSNTGKYVIMLEPDEVYQVEISGLDFETLRLEMQYEEELGEQITEVDRDFVLKLLNQQTSNDK